MLFNVQTAILQCSALRDVVLFFYALHRCIYCGFRYLYEHSCACSFCSFLPAVGLVFVSLQCGSPSSVRTLVCACVFCLFLRAVGLMFCISAVRLPVICTNTRVRVCFGLFLCARCGTMRDVGAGKASWVW